MVSLRASEREVLQSLAGLEDRVSLAAVNGRSSVVISGEEDAVLGIENVYRERGRKTKRLRVSHAFHSPRMEGMLDEFSELARTISFAAPRIPIVSNVTGEPLAAEQVCSADYWARHVREPVRFFDGVRWLHAQGVKTFLELGPDGVLSAMTQSYLESDEHDIQTRTGNENGGGNIDGVEERPVTVAPLLRGERPEAQTLIGALAQVWTRGTEVNWTAMLQGAHARKIKLPTYAFQRQRYWLKGWLGTGDMVAAGQSPATHPLLGAAVALASDRGWVFTGRVSLESHPWIADHAVMGTVLLPGTALLELALYAGGQLDCDAVSELTLEAPLLLPAEGAVQLQVSVGEPDETGERPVEIYSRLEDAPGAGVLSDEEWTRHAGGTLRPKEQVSSNARTLEERAGPLVGQSWPPDGAQAVEVDGIYRALAERGYDYGPVFQALRATWQRGGEIFAEVALSEDQQAEALRFGVHPALLDAAFHSLLLSVAEGGRPVLPFAWNDVKLLATGASSLRARFTFSGESNTIAFEAADETGASLLCSGSLIGREISSEQLAGAAAKTHRDSLFRQDWLPMPPPAPPVDRWVVLERDGGGLEESLRPSCSPSAVFADLASLGQAVDDGKVLVPDVVLVDFGVGAIDEDATAPALAAHRVLHRALALIQEWISEERWSSSRLVFMTKGAVAAGLEQGVTDLAAAPLWGLVRSAQSEHPGCFGLVDLDGTESSSLLLGGALGCGEAQVALREGRIVAPRLARVGRVDDEAALFDPDGTVLITGGTGGLGAVLARHLVVEHGVRSLVLASRQGREADGAAQLEEDLVSLGAQVTIAACDVSERGQLQELIGSVPEEYPLSAVVHTAAVFANSMIDSLTPELLDRVLAPKLDAALHLHELTQHLDLRAFVLFSSIASTFGGPGQANYAAGNAFLDALAEHRRGCGLAATSMAWPLWKTVGMGRYLDDAAVRRVTGSASLGSLSPEQGLALFDSAISSGEAMVVPAHIDNGVLRSEGNAGTLPPLLSGLVRLPSRRALDNIGGSLARRLADAPAQERGRVVLEEVRAHIALVLGHESPAAVDVQRQFLELGFDSMAAVELRNRLNSATGTRMPVTLVLDHPTPVALAEHILSEWDDSDESSVGHEVTTETRTAPRSSAGGGSGETLSSMFRQAHRLGRVEEFTGLLAAASKFRPTFDTPPEADEAPEVVRLSEGPSGPGLICLPSLIATGGAHQYAKFAKPFHGIRDLSVLPTPGFIEGERIPTTFEVAVDTQAEALQRHAAGAPFVLGGHSTGGMLAYAVAARLERIGIPPIGVVLLDTYMDRTLWDVLPQVLNGMVEREQTYMPIKDVGLTAMGAYAELLAEWKMSELACPILLVRATQPMVDRPGDDSWRAALDVPHTAVDVLGDHFTMMEEHSQTTAQAVEAWLSELS